MPKAMVTEPSARPGSHFCFWASVPKREMTVPQIAGETIIMRRGQPAAPNSSRTMASSAMPEPPPPYSSGRLTPRYPREAASDQSSSVCLPSATAPVKYSRP
jgi:hypothetical protein